MLLIVGLFVVSCDLGGTTENPDDKKVSIIMPTGTPALGLAEYAVDAKEDENITIDIVAGSDPLMAAFVNKSYNVIVAPVNLGAKMFKQYEEYVLYSTFVWGNLYIASKQQINSFEDLDGKTVVAFGKNSTPDIVMQALLKHHKDINVTLEYVSDVSEANTLLAGNQDKIIVTAEPSITKLKSKFNLSIIDLQ
jgi:NitT/TauT family transport system substrate-binding protein